MVVNSMSDPRTWIGKFASTFRLRRPPRFAAQRPPHRQQYLLIFDRIGQPHQAEDLFGFRPAFDRSWPTPGAVRVHRPRFAAFYFCVGRPIPARCRASGNVFSDNRQSLPERVLASQRVPAGTGPILRR